MDVQAWLQHALADAESRGLAPLKPLLEGLARSTQALRAADRELEHPASSEDDDSHPA
jgi:hypothetical protein